MQGGGSARVRPEHGRGPLEALEARGLDVRFEPGGSIAKYLPTVWGNFTAEFSDASGATATVQTTRLAWYWDQPPAAGIDQTRFAARVFGTFVPDRSGEWELGVRAVGPASVRVDGETVVELAEAQHGGAFFGLGSPEVRSTVTLEDGQSYELTVDYPLEDGLVRGLVVGAGPVPAGDHVELAAAAARAADVAVVIVGTDDDWETEGEDRTSMALPGDQDDLVRAVVAANPRTIVVLNSGSPVLMPWLDDVPAVLQLWFPGQEIGDALADVLTGVAEPGGRLPVTFPRRLEDTPAFAHYPGTDGRAVYGEGLLIGHRWYDRHGIDPMFPFGFGLGYTTFELDDAIVQGGIERGVTLDVTVTNTGQRDGAEVVQVYVEPPPDDADRPLRHLAAFSGSRSPAVRRHGCTSSSTGGPSPPGSTACGPFSRATTPCSSDAPHGTCAPSAASPPPDTTTRRAHLIWVVWVSNRHLGGHSLESETLPTQIDGGGLRQRRQSIGSRPAAINSALARENGREPKNPLCADSGDG